MTILEDFVKERISGNCIDVIKVMHHSFVASGVVTNDAQFGTSSS